MRLLLLTLVACAPVSEPCAAMCAAWAEARGGCLALSGLGWEAAGYAEEDDAQDACETWAWEQRLLAVDAGEAADAVDAACTARHEEIPEESTEETCDALNTLNWGGP